MKTELLSIKHKLSIHSSVEEFIDLINSVERTSPDEALELAKVAVGFHKVPLTYLKLVSFYQKRNEKNLFRETMLKSFQEVDFSEVNYVGNLKLATLAFDCAAMDLAIQMFEKLAIAHSKNMHAQMNLAFILKEAHQFEKSEKIYRNILRANPSQSNVSWNFSHLLLLNGKYKEGLEHYESRWFAKGFPSKRRDFSQPLWDGKSKKMNLLIHAEQGFGDTIQAARYLHLAQQKTEHVILEIQRELLPLFQKSISSLKLSKTKVRWVLTGEPLPDFDEHIPMMSLPKILGLINFDHPPLSSGYLFTEPLIHRVQNQNEIQPMFVGLVWKGRPSHPHDGRRSFKLTDLVPILRTPGIKFFSFQQRVTPAEKEILNQYNVVDLESRLTSFNETAGLIKGMDLMICTDSAVAHASAALGIQTWVGLAACPDWRWGVSGETTPWYQSLMLMRQGVDRVWQPVFQNMASKLLETLANWLLEKKWLHRQD
jgi:tetratricopeptide (TPR) repeat protein